MSDERWWCWQQTKSKMWFALRWARAVGTFTLEPVRRTMCACANYTGRVNDILWWWFRVIIHFASKYFARCLNCTSERTKGNPRIRGACKAELNGAGLRRKCMANRLPLKIHFWILSHRTWRTISGITSLVSREPFATLSPSNDDTRSQIWGSFNDHPFTITRPSDDRREDLSFGHFLSIWMRLVTQCPIHSGFLAQAAPLTRIETHLTRVHIYSAYGTWVGW